MSQLCVDPGTQHSASALWFALQVHGGNRSLSLLVRLLSGEPERRRTRGDKLRLPPWNCRASQRALAERCCGKRVSSSPRFMEDVELESGRPGLMRFFDEVKDLTRMDGGPPRWFSPLECGTRLEKSPCFFIYLVGSPEIEDDVISCSWS
ncbi:hypothetical protein NL676_039424 [Syzygium grande]|nr:hypothetical protein NL676_039424 [Syzygium grande]